MVCAYVPVRGNRNSDKQSILAKLQFSPSLYNNIIPLLPIYL